MPQFLSNERRLHFEDAGGAGEPVLLLHGLGSRSPDWQPQVEALARNFRVLTLDFPGHGRSDPLRGPVSIADLAADVVALLDHLRLPGVHVVGLSLGGMVAFQLAADRPQRLRSFVVINAAPGPGTLGWRFKLQIASRVLLIRFFGLPVLAKRIAPKLFPQTEQAPLRQQFLDSVAVADKQSYLHIVRAIGRFDVSEALADCTLPALILTADQDYTPVAFKRDFVARMRSAQLCVIANSRHATPLDSPDVCNREINEFLQRQSAGSPERQRRETTGA